MSAEVANPTGTVVRRYVRGPAGDEPIIWYEGSGTATRRWLDADERGSVTRITNDAGTTLAINSYDDYGIPQSTNLGRFQYTGQAWLPEMGLYYYKARIYSATLGRFLQTDPAGYGDGLNWYNYVGSDPINGADPSGLGDDNDNKNTDGNQCTGTHICGRDNRADSIATGGMASFLLGGSGSGGGAYGGSYTICTNCGEGAVTLPDNSVLVTAPIYQTYYYGGSQVAQRGNFQGNYNLQPAAFLFNPYAHIRITPQNLEKLAATHYGTNQAKSYFNDEFAHPAGIAILASYAASTTVPFPGSQTGTLNYVARFSRSVGYSRGNPNPTRTFTLQVFNTYTFAKDGRPIYNFVNIFPGLP